MSRLRGIEDRVYVKVEGHDPVYAVADEDLDRSTDLKTAAVHFLRFELTEDMIADLGEHKAGFTVGVDHPEYSHTTGVYAGTVKSLIRDFDSQPSLTLS